MLDGDVDGSRGGKIDAFQSILALILLVEPWCRALVLWEDLGPLDFGLLASSTCLACIALATPRSGGVATDVRRTAFAALGVTQLLVLWRDFPVAGNHAYLEAMLCGLAALLDPRQPPDRVLFLRAVRWMGIVILFTSGLQKLVHGFYFGGEQLAYALWIESFRPVLATLMPAAEFERLAALRGAVGDGPYAVDGTVFVLASNLVWLAEIALAILLVPKRTRTIAVVGSAAMLLAIEVAAREVFFGLLFANVLLLYLPGRPTRARTAAFATVLGYLLLVRIGVGPSWSFY